MNNRQYRYIQKMRYGIRGAVRKAAEAGFEVDRVVVRPQDLKLIRKANITGNPIIAGVDVVSGHGKKDGEDLSKNCFYLITSAPEDYEQMQKESGLVPGTTIDI